MKLPPARVLDILHAARHGALATHSLAMPGFPFVTPLPVVIDARHCPVFLISTLAEHTRNLEADARASLMVTDPAAEDVQTGGRITLTGHAERTDDPAIRERFLRYRPDAEDLLALGDFHFWRLTPLRVRAVLGFGSMGWLEAGDWDALPVLDADTEQALLARHPAVDGIDLFGIDLHDGHRLAFGGQVAPSQLDDQVRDALSRRT